MKSRTLGFSEMRWTSMPFTSTTPYGTWRSYWRTPTVIAASASRWKLSISKKLTRVSTSPLMTSSGPVGGASRPTAPAVPSGRSSRTYVISTPNTGLTHQPDHLGRAGPSQSRERSQPAGVTRESRHGPIQIHRRQNGASDVSVGYRRLQVPLAVDDQRDPEAAGV